MNVDMAPLPAYKVAFPLKEQLDRQAVLAKAGGAP
jgi:hypothetical protein